MKFDRSLLLKWIDPAKSPELNLNTQMVNYGLVVAKRGNVNLGFAVTEARSIDEAFCERLLIRYNNAKSTDITYSLYVPTFLQHRCEKLFADPKFQFLKITYTPFLAIKVEHGTMVYRSRIRVVNVDDSPVLLKFLRHTLSEHPFIDIVAQVSKSTEAFEAIRKTKPDFITLDIQMPEKNGVEVLKEVLAHEYVPVIMISSLNLEDGSLVFDALNAGAFDYIQKPKIEEREDFKQDLTTKMLHSIEGREAHSSIKSLGTKKPKAVGTATHGGAIPSNLVWCIGSSTGGTQALTHVFTSMPNEIPPTLIVQHIPPVFSLSFANSLNSLCPFEVKEAADGDVLKPNHVYIAPGGTQMALEKRGTQYVICIRDDAPVNRFKPSVDYMFKSVAKVDGLQLVAGILTGMGRDGAEGLLALKQIGARTFAQDQASSTVYGMPRAAFEIGATDEVCSLDQVATTMLNLSQSSYRKRSA